MKGAVVDAGASSHATIAKTGHFERLILSVIPVVGVLAVAGAIRAAVQPGIPLYADSYQMMLLADGLTQSVPVSNLMGPSGDAWGVPFHRLGYSFVVAPFTLFSDDPFAPGVAVSFVAGIAAVAAVYTLVLRVFGRRFAALAAASLLAISFSASNASRWPMTESLAALMVSLTLLLAALGRDRRPLVVAAGAAAAITVLVRLELVLALPAAALFAQGSGGRRLDRSGRLFLASAGAWFILLAAIVGITAQDAVDNFTLNPLFVLDSAFVSAPQGFGGERLVFPLGVLIFVAYDPLLSIAALGGVVWWWRAREDRLAPLALSLALLFGLYSLWNVPRHFASMVPLLAVFGGYASDEVATRLLGTLRRMTPLQAAILSSAACLVLFIAVGGQLGLSVSNWHGDGGYEAEVAETLQARAAQAGLRPVVCSFSPEAHYLVSGFSARRLSAADLSLCRPNTGERVLIVVDEGVRRHLDDDFEAEVAGVTERWTTFEVDAPYLKEAEVYEDTRPVVVYLWESK